MSFLFGNRSSSKTFKPKKNIPEGSHQHELMKHAAATLGSGAVIVILGGWVNNHDYKATCAWLWCCQKEKIWMSGWLSTLWTSSTRSTCCTAPSLSFAQNSPAQSCRQDLSMRWVTEWWWVGSCTCTHHILSSTTGLMVIRSRSQSSVQLPSILTSSWLGFRQDQLLCTCVFWYIFCRTS